MRRTRLGKRVRPTESEAMKTHTAKWTDGAIQPPTAPALVSWWAKPALQTDRRAFDRRARQEATRMSVGKFGRRRVLIDDEGPR